MEPEREFENTFAPDCENRTLTIDQIITGLQFSAFHIDKLPKDIRDAVHEEMEVRRSLIQKHGSLYPDPKEMWKLDLLDARLEIRGRTPNAAKTNPILAEPLSDTQNKIHHKTAVLECLRDEHGLELPTPEMIVQVKQTKHHSKVER